MNTIKNWLQEFELHLQPLIEHQSEPKNLYEPIAHILSIGGKRIRPLMALAAYQCYQKELTKEVFTLALSVEMFHNFTLLHDDIMDKSPVRRGQPTVHVKWDVPTAILSGDLLQILVYQKLNELNHQEVTTAFNEMAVALCEGQMWDMSFEQMEVVENDHHLDMIRKKTAVLLGFSLQGGGMLAGVSKAEQQKLYDLGISLGMAFQLMDDYLDSFGESAAVGKRIGNDILEKKKTFLWNFMYTTFSENEKTALNQMYAQNDEETIIDWVKNKMTISGAKAQTLQLAEDYAKKAQTLFNNLQIQHDATGLDEILQLLNQRKN